MVDRAGQPPAPPPRNWVVHTAFAQFVGLGLRPAQRPLGVGEQPFGLLGGEGGQLGQLAGDPAHGGLRLVAAGRRAGAQLGRDLMRAPSRPARERSRTLVRIAPPAARIRLAVAAIRRTALASKPESVG